jgi:alkanesulfonate monooxygenase SsuD/methylene tetrahydromethanopterin reductase-like flavin-dependent oxidoreductase (luciferase family)
MIVDVQYSAAHNDWRTLRDAILRDEAEGTYGTTWVLDHFDGTTFTDGDRDVLEAFTFLGALAAATSTIGLGSLVANVANRHPELLSLAAATVQEISGGRLTLGLGAGAAPETPWSREHKERGIPLQPRLEDRHAAVVHQIEVVRHRTPSIQMIVGVNSEALGRIAGTYADGVNIRLSSPHSARYLAAARDAAQAAGKPSFDCSGWCSPDDQASIDKAHELGLDRLIISKLFRL